MTVPQICIVGAGISGLVLGRCLLQYGLRAVLFEKSRPSQNRNRYGITLHSASYRPLLKLLNIEENSFRSQTAVDAAVAGTGRLSKEIDDTSFRANRSRLERLLAEGLDIRYEHQLEALTSTSDLILQFEDGTQHKTDLLVGADGVHSRVRQHVAPGTDFKILPYAVYNGKRRISQVEFSSKLKKHLHGGNTLEERINNTVFQISVDDYTEDEVNISYNYSRPPKPGQDPLYRPTRSKSEATNIPDAFFDEIDSQQLEEPYRFIFDSTFMRKDRILNWLMRTLQTERHFLDQAVDKRIVLLGEAVHAEPILGGYGANEAIKDGMTLAEMLIEDQRLASFYKSRMEDWVAGVKASEQRLQQMHSSLRSSL